MDECVKWLKRIGNNGKHHLQRPVSPPEVLFLQKTSSPVVCFATGFYPRAVIMSLQRNGEDVSQNVSVGETLPNDDGTFQKNVSLSVTPEEWNKNRYSCVVQHNDRIKNLTEDIETNHGPQQRNRALILIPCFLFILVLFILAVLWMSQHGCPCTVFAGLMGSTPCDKGKTVLVWWKKQVPTHSLPPWPPK
ncbi:BOLA class I histocompatibility antigen, alpha chain BL3-7-like [Colossoma macropomum]|uniref:BOLA class I histocompatibility antigen, alpha chain BL3-7-like n=1 Tax=Colossoma macropomum TaxID=42526 RepID=UPI0018647859|nr:BOLA class I histocompatibility antigen, alpha chain BL3-7-like [Colossoma macropomum]